MEWNGGYMQDAVLERTTQLYSDQNSLLMPQPKISGRYSCPVFHGIFLGFHVVEDTDFEVPANKDTKMARSAKTLKELYLKWAKTSKNGLEVHKIPYFGEVVFHQVFEVNCFTHSLNLLFAVAVDDLWCEITKGFEQHGTFY